MASLVRVVDCPGCGASEWVIRVMTGARGLPPRPVMMIRCADCGRLLADVHGLGLDPAAPDTETTVRTLIWAGS